MAANKDRIVGATYNLRYGSNQSNQGKCALHSCKRLRTQSLDLVEILYSDAVTKVLLSVRELFLE